MNFVSFCFIFIYSSDWALQLCKHRCKKTPSGNQRETYNFLLKWFSNLLCNNFSLLFTRILLYSFYFNTFILCSIYIKCKPDLLCCSFWGSVFSFENTDAKRDSQGTKEEYLSKHRCKKTPPGNQRKTYLFYTIYKNFALIYYIFHVKM